MKPTLGEAIGHLKTPTEPSERLTDRLEELIHTSVEPSRASRWRDWVGVGTVGCAIVAGGWCINRLNVAAPTLPVLAASPSANAHVTLEKAYQSLGPVEKKWQLYGYGTITRRHRSGPLSESEQKELRRKVVFSHKETLHLLHKAMRQEFIPPSPENYLIYNPTGQDISMKYYGLVKLLSIEVRAKTDIGDKEGALQEAMDIIVLGANLEKGGQWKVWVAAHTTQYIGLQELERLIPILSKAQAVKAADLLATLETKHPPLSEMFQATRWAAYSTFQKKSWDEFIAERGITFGPRSTRALRVIPKAWIIAEHLRYLERLEHSHEPQSAPPDAFNQLMGDYFSQAFKDENYIKTSTAIVISRLRRKADAKAPLSEDPFAPGKSLRERADGLIYSVGPDGVDNGGISRRGRDKQWDITITQLP